jgi:predicted negative regulator of RcsB-dependent stress response
MRKIKPLPSVKKEPALTGLAQALAEKSVTERETVISETLARLLVQQGHKEKAINMYQRLSLAFPEKSEYFAAEIDKLKK